MPLKQWVAALLCASLSFSLSAAEKDSGYSIKYDGGSLGDTKTGTDVRIAFDQAAIRVLQDKKHGEEIASIPVSAVTEISYGQDVHRRVGAAIGLAVVSFSVGALMALTKSKKHYIGITWDDNGKKGGFAFQADKNDYRGILTGLEGVTGKKAVDSDSLTVKN